MSCVELSNDDNTVEQDDEFNVDEQVTFEPCIGRMTLHVAALLFPGWLLRHELKVSSASV